RRALCGQAADRRPASQSEVAGGADGAEAPLHTPVQSQHRWLCSVLRGHDAYYGLPSNWPRVDRFHDAVRRRWYRVLRRRSQRRLTWEQFNALLERFPLPSTRITHPREVSLARVG